MASEKQIAANRANSQRSTGPRTPEGKAASRRNATRHGLLARAVLLEAECPRQFDAFANSYYAEYDPQTPTERGFVNEMILARWLQLRLTRFESTQIDREFVLQDTPELAALDNATRAGIAFRDVVVKSPVFTVINSRDTRLQRRFEGAFDRFLRYREQQRSFLSDADRLAPPPQSIRRSQFPGTENVPQL